MVITHEKLIYRLNLQVFMGWVWGHHQQARVFGGGD